MDNNIRLIIVEQSNEVAINNFLEKYPFIINHVSIVMISDESENIDYRIIGLLKEDFVKTIILEDGFLKIFFDNDLESAKEKLHHYSISSDILVKRLRYVREKKYGIIIKSENSTEKVIKYDTEDVIEPNSNLINLKYTL
jgi:hypothetical protein